MEESSCQNTPEDPKEEVKKLQEMVRKLELQNQQLRNRQNVSSKDETESKSCKGESNSSPMIHGPRTPLRTLDSHLNPNGLNIESEDSRSNDSRFLGAEKRESRKSGVLDDVDLINIEDLDISDEDSWLYTSPKGLSSEERSVSPHKWLRKDVEDLQNKELQLAKRALAYKLDESAILSSRRASDSATFKKSPRGKPPIGRVVDSRTFTRGRKKRTSFEEGCDTLPVIEAFRDDEEEEDDEREADSYSVTPHRSTDVIDVQGIARMQEESLRQSSPSTPKRISISSISGRRWSNSSKNSMSDNEEVSGSQHPTDGSPRQVPLSQDQSDACCTNSAHSSPPESLHGSNSSLDNGTETFRHSLPNLSKGYNGARNFQRQQPGCLQVEMNGSPARILGSGGKLSSIARSSAIQGERRLGLASRSASNLRSPSTSHRLQQQQQQRQVVNGSPSPPCITPPALSPTTSRNPSGITPPKVSGLPRLSRIPAPRSRSSIPALSSRGSLENETAENELWSDGCY